jgi:hypothetical protein
MIFPAATTLPGPYKLRNYSGLLQKYDLIFDPYRL